MAAIGAAPRAEAQTVNFAAGTYFNSPGIASSTTTGSSMNGMLVTWTFVDGSSLSKTWGSLGPAYSGVMSGSNLAVDTTANSNTFSGSFYLESWTFNPIRSVRFNGAPGRTVFDCAWNGAACSGAGSSGGFNGTPGSLTGATATTTSTDYLGRGVDVTFTFSNMVGINGAAPVGDLFEQLLVEFGGTGFGPFYKDDLYYSNSDYYDFLADTDNSDLTQPPPAPTPVSTVPEPDSYALLAMGLGSLAIVAHRRRRRSA
jgi:hypothetical protein